MLVKDNFDACTVESVAGVESVVRQRRLSRFDRIEDILERNAALPEAPRQERAPRPFDDSGP